ncbi:PLP-dependent aminotransferase family protein [Nocardioides mesophilus]|uniref:Aminotransferase class I/II-fold pyridoxal phosphate-dependent enzyme n=1 Tax=Nocardioides mesophilus TaxID=433659 RepID=A0A7G9R8Z7_9ACTN|nr:aminotransferase class I/II-fold pyridoxal phosphate-dependent enzyme [Nocardioides mesophilus]QNN52072.1 aminotransferase class I/II-fold pyridoxal phosphate-dependent enzyme [Nocardioides mesophilus]
MLDVLSRHLTDPSSRGLAQAVSAAIRVGELTEGDRLPPIRSVAAHLGLSPTTVSAAWSLLARAGTLRTDGRRGTTVAATRAAPTRYRRALEHTQSFALDLSSGVPDPALLPDLGAALAVQATTSDGARAGHSSYLDDPTLPRLAEVLRADWPYAAQGLTVVDGAMDAVQQIVALHLRWGDVVLVEHPCFPPLLDLLESVGAHVQGLRMDDEGVLPAELEAHLGAARMLVLQPRAQNPTGVSMTAGRAEQLAAVLAGSGVLVVEDDAAGATSAADALSLGRWLPADTLHVRSFSKSHGPDLRLAAVSGPSRMIDQLNDRRYLGQGWSSRLLQGVLLHLLTDEEAVRQVERARGAYAGRRDRMRSSLADHGVSVTAADGINLWLPVRDEVGALLRLASRGIGAAAGTPFEVLPREPRGQQHLRVTVGLLADDHDGVAEELAAAAGTGSWSGPR